MPSQVALGIGIREMSGTFERDGRPVTYLDVKKAAITSVPTTVQNLSSFFVRSFIAEMLLALALQTK